MDCHVQQLDVNGKKYGTLKHVPICRHYPLSFYQVHILIHFNYCTTLRKDKGHTVV